MPNQVRPAMSNSPRSPRAGLVHPRVRSRAPKRMLPSVRRPRARAPGEKARPAALMPTNADAQRHTETSAAARGSQVRGRFMARTYTEIGKAGKGAGTRPTSLRDHHYGKHRYDRQ